MGWEWRQNAGPYYIRTRKVQGQVVRTYFGRGPQAEQAAREDAQRQATQVARHTVRVHLAALDVQVHEWCQQIDNLMRASLMVTGFHQHHRSEWRQRSDGLAPIDAWASGADVPQADWPAASYALDQEEQSMSENDTPQELTTSLQTLVQRGMDGDRTVLPALRELLTTRPELWRHLRTLGMQVEYAWIHVLAGEDLVAQEVLAQQLQGLKVELGGPSPTPLERLLVERIAVCWLQTCQVDLQALQQLQTTPTQLPEQESWLQQRQDRTQARLLAAIKTLAQVRKLLKPSTATVQVNIAQQHVNVG
jgi:hypothetical protein